ncbi:hypothetical protein, partial [Mesorhizobium sp. M0019]|uniref:hypothetical protein n=1 Tax=Mesorhizobium sp. M0019 TaxID=2956845 RepID=UPI00333D76EE
MPGGEANAIFYLVDRAGLEGATATSGVLACDVCFQDAEKLISTAENAEGFRVPSGVRKSLMQEPAGRRRLPMGI